MVWSMYLIHPQLLFGDLDTGMKDLDEKAKLEDTLQSAPPPKFTKVSVHPSAGKDYVPRASARRANSRFPSSSSASKDLRRFPTMDNLSTTGETTQRKQVARQKVNTFLFPLLVVDQLADVSRCYQTWADFTTDSFVLDIVKHGITLDFCFQAFCSKYTRCSLTADGAKAVDAEIKLLLLKHVISPAELKVVSFVSSIFTTMKPDGSHRTILNLKNLNESITDVHFKMESLKHVRQLRQLIKPEVWMGSINPRDRVHPPFQRYFTCYWKGCY